MNILLMDGLPEEYESIPISPDFRNMIQADLCLHDEELSPYERTMAALNQLYPQIPSDPEVAVAGFNWFFTRGHVDDTPGSAAAQRKPFDFTQDAEVLYESFYEAYGARLSEIGFMHWWEFMALFERLPEKTLMRRVMYWRTVDLGKLRKEEKKHVSEMRNIYALKGPVLPPMSAEELAQHTKDKAARRLAEAKRLATERRQKSEKANPKV